MPSVNPLPLSASQEAQVRDLYFERVRRHCAPEIKGASVQSFLTLSLSLFPGPLQSTADSEVFTIIAFAECAVGRTFSVSFACRETHRAMNSCMKAHATQAEQDASREEWFARRMERAHERERKGRRKAEQERFLREWWGLPERDAEERRREEEKLKMGERIGGFPARDRRPVEGATGKEP